ncbi:MAG: phosphorylase [Nostocaceae cyanobacterium]|nr:phosphorylase [Nostocaceae cyanobacterium]
MVQVVSSTNMLILVPQGAEYQAVCRGLKQVADYIPPVVPIPVGSNSITIYLEKCQNWQELLNHPQPRVLVMGLCGGLNPRYPVGEIVLYENCVKGKNLQKCHQTLITELSFRLPGRVSLVRGLTSDRVICQAAQKRRLGEEFAADVVDMEGFAILEYFQQLGIGVAILRVVSDGCDDDLPELNSAISPEGSLQNFALAIAMLKQPIAAIRLIRGSLRGLQVLEEVTASLFQG